MKSAVRTVRLLEYLADRGGRPARLRELADALGAPRSSTHVLIRSLEAEGWIRSDLSGTLFTLGLRSLSVGGAFLESDSYVRAAHPVLLRLRDAVNATVHMGRIDGERVIYLSTLESRRESRPFSRIGRWMPAHATALGKALLAARGALPHGPLAALTEHTLTDPEALATDLAATREQGYAVEREENTVGTGCVSLALRYTSPAQDALSCSMPVERLTPQTLEEVVAALQRARDELEESAPAFGSL